MVPDGAVLNRWAMLLDPTTFARLRVRRRALFPPGVTAVLQAYTSKGTEKMLRQGIWKLVDASATAAVAPAPSAAAGVLPMQHA